MQPDPQDLLQQLESRIGGVEDPLEALAGLLGASSRARGRLFDLAGSTLAGCRLQRILGAGGMGVTYAGESADGDLVAVKLVADLQTASRDRFEQECRLLQSFNHPHIVHYRHHEVLPDGTGALVMEHIQGIDLEQLLVLLSSDEPRASDHSVVQNLLQDVETRAPLWLSPRYRRRMLRLLADVAAGLHAAHERGVVHRDVKPANILVRSDLSPVVIDFGLARDGQNRVSFTRSGAALGTLSYMAPEQLGRDASGVDRRTDVYALGLVLYRAMTGSDLRNDVDAVLLSGRRSFLLDAKVSRALPIDVQAILYRCLDPRPAHRYPTAQALAEDLRAAAGQGAVAARRPAIWARWMRDAKLRAAAALLLSASLALLVYAQWPRGRWVHFAANCAAAEVRIRVDGERAAWLDDPMWLSMGSHRVELTGSTFRRVEVPFDVQAGQGAQWVPIVTFEEGRLPNDLKLMGRTPVQFMTGYQWEFPAPGVPRDRRFVDGQELARPEPVDPSLLAPGRHELRAVDGLGRTESLSIDVADAPLDIQLLPAVLADVGGEYRRTWSTVLSPLPQDLELTRRESTPWLGNWLAPMFGYGLQQAPCALVPSAANEAVVVELRCRFPKLMRSAVVALSGSRQPGGELQVEAGFEGAPLQAWPMDDAGQLVRRQAFASKQGAKSLVITARMRSSAAPTSSLALVRMFDGRVFGGHWRDIPPCLAIAADPGDAASIPQPIRPNPVGVLPTSAELHRLALPAGDPKTHVLMTCPMQGPNGAMDVWFGMGSEDFSVRRFERRSWPDLALVSTMLPEVMHPRARWTDGISFGNWLTNLPDVDGDGWDDLAVSDRSSEIFGRLYGGSAALLRSRDLAIAWRWPQTQLKSDFGDANAYCAGDCGDWNGDGYPDLIMNSLSANSSTGVLDAGFVEVVDGRTGQQIWRQEAAQPRAYLEARTTIAIGDPRAPWPIVMSTKLRMSERDELDSYRHSVWMGGKNGHAVVGPRVPSPSCLALVRSAGAAPAWAVLIYRCGVWQDNFVGLERYELGATEWELTHRIPIEHPQSLGSVPAPTIDYQSTQVADVDGDGWLDAAFLTVADAQSSACLIASGRDGSLLARVPQIHPRVFGQSRLMWLPAGSGQPAQLLISNLKIEPGDKGPVFGAIQFARPLTR